MFEITTRPPNTFLFNNNSNLNIVSNSPYHRSEHQQNQVDHDFKTLRRNQSALNNVNSSQKTRSSSSIAVTNTNSLLKPIGGNSNNNSMPLQSQLSSSNYSNPLPPQSPNLNYAYYTRQNLNRIQINHNGNGNLLNRPVLSSNSNFSKANDLNLFTNTELINNAKQSASTHKSNPNSNNESITSTVLPVYYQKDSNSSKLPLVTNKQQQSKSLPFSIKSNLPNSILPTIINNATVDSRVGSAIVTISTGGNNNFIGNKQQENVNKHQIITTRASSPYINFYESHPETISNTPNTQPNRLANMYKSNLTNNYNSNAPIYLNDVNNSTKKHVHFFDSPYKFPTPASTTTTTTVTTNNNTNNSNIKQQISLIKGIKVRSDMIYVTPLSTNGHNYETNDNIDVTKTSVMVSQAPSKPSAKKDENEDSDNYYYSTVNSIFNAKSESNGATSTSTPDSFARPKLDESIFTNTNNGEVKIEHFNNVKKSILIKKKHRSPIVASISSKSSSNNSHKKVTFAA